ncbi:MAG: hypothetical protein JWL73_145 [Actinomycetia bacterium]|nr:hypothetical protein [Actinomycetes bacterium]
MDYIISRTLDNGLRRGLLGGNKVWVVVGAVALGTRILRWSGRRSGRAHVQRFHMEPGTSLQVIAHSPDR